MQTPLQELIGLMPDAVQIKQFISETDADEKMLDEWLWERLYKGRFWIEQEKQMIVDAWVDGGKMISSAKSGEQYYNDNYK